MALVLPLDSRGVLRDAVSAALRETLSDMRPSSNVEEQGTGGIWATKNLWGLLDMQPSPPCLGWSQRVNLTLRAM